MRKTLTMIIAAATLAGCRPAGPEPTIENGIFSHTLHQERYLGAREAVQQADGKEGYIIRSYDLDANRAADAYGWFKILDTTWLGRLKVSDRASELNFDVDEDGIIDLTAEDDDGDYILDHESLRKKPVPFHPKNREQEQATPKTYEI